jgi:glycosyltransferase involved in cell wall biosynthesis
MKIHWLTKKYFDIATDRTTRLEMMKAMHSLGHRVILVTTFKRSRTKWDNPGEIVYLPTVKAKWLNHLTFFVSAWFYLLHIFIADRPDVIMVDHHSAPATLPFCLLARAGLTRARFFLDVRTVPVETFGLTGRFDEALFRLSIFLAKHMFSGITVISPAMRDLIEKEYALAGDKIGIWSSGVSLSHFNPKSIPQNKLRQLRRDLDLDGKFVVLYHGTLSLNRGLLEAIEACQTAVESCPELCLMIIGHGEARSKLQDKAHSLNLESSIRLLNAIPYEDMPLYIALADIGILPFPDLGWWRVSSPLKLLEYFAMEKPVVVTDIEAHRQVMGSAPLGFFAASNNPEDLSGAMLKACGSGEAQLKKMGASARELVEKQYTWDRQAERLEEFLDRKTERGWR